ncbi:MAG: hypothetical protein H6513_19580 [Acidimicrobiaceae bacterium]|nr:hypothetical protein [Ilumatobacter sp.]MCB9382894.1 hypothetical protein [Acidimicrobiaceae bacterium]
MDRLEVVFGGVVFGELACEVDVVDVGCRVEQTDVGYRLVVDDFPAGAMLSVSGRVAGFTDRMAATGSDAGSGDFGEDDDVSGVRVLLVLGTLICCLAAAWVARSAVVRRRARGDDAAIAACALPGPLTDDEVDWMLDQLDPTEAVMLWRRSMTPAVVDAWFATMIARGALVPGNRQWSLTRGAGDALLELPEELNEALLSGEMVVGEPMPGGPGLWRGIVRTVQARVRGRGWWLRGGPGGPTLFPWRLAAGLVVASLVATWSVVTGWSNDWWFAGAMVLVVPAGLAMLAELDLGAWLSPVGHQGLAELGALDDVLRSGPAAVDRAWQAGRLPEMGAWAVALGSSGSWAAALRASSVPLDERRTLAAPLWPGVLGRVWSAAYWPTLRFHGFDPDGQVPLPFELVPDNEVTASHPSPPGK